MRCSEMQNVTCYYCDNCGVGGPNYIFDIYTCELCKKRFELCLKCEINKGVIINYPYITGSCVFVCKSCMDGAMLREYEKMRLEFIEQIKS